MKQKEISLPEQRRLARQREEEAEMKQLVQARRLRTLKSDTALRRWANVTDPLVQSIAPNPRTPSRTMGEVVLPDMPKTLVVPHLNAILTSNATGHPVVLVPNDPEDHRPAQFPQGGTVLEALTKAPDREYSGS